MSANKSCNMRLGTRSRIISMWKVHRETDRLRRGSHVPQSLGNVDGVLSFIDVVRMLAHSTDTLFGDLISGVGEDGSMTGTK
jgi:hypothetical protein